MIMDNKYKSQQSFLILLPHKISPDTIKLHIDLVQNLIGSLLTGLFKVDGPAKAHVYAFYKIIGFTA